MTRPNMDRSTLHPTNPNNPANMGPVGAVDPGIGHDPNAPHRVADDTEQVYFEGAPLLRSYVGQGLLWIFAGILLIAVPIVVGIWEKKWSPFPWWATLALVVIGLLLIAVPFLRAKSISYRITNYRIDVERGFFSRKRDTIEMWHIEEPELYQSFIDRIFGIGTITIISRTPTLSRLVMSGLPHPRELFTTLEQRIIAVKRQGGVLKMDPGSVAPGQ